MIALVKWKAWVKQINPFIIVKPFNITHIINWPISMSLEPQFKRIITNFQGDTTSEGRKNHAI